MVEPKGHADKPNKKENKMSRMEFKKKVFYLRYWNNVPTNNEMGGRV